MTESHAKAQARVFAMYVKNNRKDDNVTETTIDAEASGSVVEYLDNILIAMSNLSLDTERLKQIARQNLTGATIKSASEVPRINISDLKKLLLNKSVILKFNSNRTELSILDDIKNKIAEINKLQGIIEVNNEAMETSRSAFAITRPNPPVAGRPSYQIEINKSIYALMNSLYKEVKDNILPVLTERMTLLTSKLERYTVKNLVGGGFGGRPYKLKYDLMYQFFFFF